MKSIIITELEGIDTYYYPIHIGTQFVKGEIPNFPQAVIDGQSVRTQVERQEIRWDDGSFWSGPVSFYIPRLDRKSTINVTFIDQSSLPNMWYDLSLNGFLAWDFRAVIETNLGVVDLRDMLEAGAYVVRNQGTLYTELLVRDDSLERAFDFGQDEHRSIRPEFHIGIWLKRRAFRCRFVLNNCNSETLQDQIYSVKLMLGTHAEPSLYFLYDRPEFKHYAYSRWSQSAWWGFTPSKIRIDYDRNYLAQTGLHPKFPNNIRATEEVVAKYYADYMESIAIGDAVLWYPHMGLAGAQPNIGAMPDHIALWYTSDFDPRVTEVVNAMEDAVGQWQVHVIGGRADKNLLVTDTPDSGTELGHIISIVDRPDLYFFEPSRPELNPNDQVLPIGEVGEHYTAVPGFTEPLPWRQDVSHQPEIGCYRALLTWDLWNWQEAMFHNAWMMGGVYPKFHDTGAGRGPVGNEGAMELIQGGRSFGWQISRLGLLARTLPPSFPEKQYFEYLLMNSIAAEEGGREIRGTQFEGNTMWEWAREKRRFMQGEGAGLPEGLPPLHNFWRGNMYLVQPDQLDPARVSVATAFEQFTLYGLGLLVQLGYPALSLLEWFGEHYIQRMVHPDSNPCTIESIRTPSVDDIGQWIQTWKQLNDCYIPAIRDKQEFWTSTESYAHWCIPGLSLLCRHLRRDDVQNVLMRRLIEPTLNEVQLPAGIIKWLIVP